MRWSLRICPFPEFIACDAGLCKWASQMLSSPFLCFSVHIPITYTKDLTLKDPTQGGLPCWCLAIESWRLEKALFLNSPLFICSPWFLFIPSLPGSIVYLGIKRIFVGGGMSPCLPWEVIPTSSIYMYILLENSKGKVYLSPSTSPGLGERQAYQGSAVGHGFCVGLPKLKSWELF